MFEDGARVDTNSVEEWFSKGGTVCRDEQEVGEVILHAQTGQVG